MLIFASSRGCGSLESNESFTGTIESETVEGARLCLAKLFNMADHPSP